MESAIDHVRVAQILEMLLSLSKGRFDCRIPLSGEDDDLEAVVVTLNLMAEEMNQTLAYYSHLRAPEGVTESINLLVFLDMDFRVKSMNIEASRLFEYRGTEAAAISFSQYIATNGQQLWKSITKSLLHSDSYEAKHQLPLLLPSGLVKDTHFTIYTRKEYAAGLFEIVLCSYETKLTSVMLEDEVRQAAAKKVSSPKSTEKASPFLSTQDLHILQSAHDYILQNLSSDLPSLRELAHICGTNENKLKYGFKQLFGQTIFRFQKNERLVRASMYLRNTEMDIKTISRTCGFKSFSHFSRVFKEKYGYCPTQLRGGKRMRG